MKAITPAVLLKPGRVLRTSYGTGPYRVTAVSGPCDCPRYLDVLDLGDRAPKSELHFHAVCEGWRRHGRTGVPEPGSRYYLNGFRSDGTSVWDDDRLIALGWMPHTQLDLFPGHLRGTGAAPATPSRAQRSRRSNPTRPSQQDLE